MSISGKAGILLLCLWFRSSASIGSFNEAFIASRKTHNSVQLQDVDTMTSVNTGYFSIQIHPDLSCNGVAEEYSAALDTCSFEGYDSSNNLVMRKFVNLSIYSDESLSMTKMYYSDINCSQYSSDEYVSLPGCAVVNGKSYQFSYKSEMSIFAVDGVLEVTNPTPEDCGTNDSSKILYYAYVPLNKCLTRDEFTYHIYSDCYRDSNGTISYTESYYGNANCSEVIYDGYTDTNSIHDTCLFPDSASSDVIASRRNRVKCTMGVPTSSPTFQPTVSLRPTALTTVRPTSHPTVIPTISPTTVDEFETNNPTATPTTAPVSYLLLSPLLRAGYQQCKDTVAVSYPTNYNTSLLFATASSSGYCTLYQSYTSCGNSISPSCFPSCLSLPAGWICSSLVQLSLTCPSGVAVSEMNATAHAQKVALCNAAVLASNSTKYGSSTNQIKFEFALTGVGLSATALREDAPSRNAITQAVGEILAGVESVNVQFEDISSVLTSFIDESVLRKTARLRKQSTTGTVRVIVVASAYTDLVVNERGDDVVMLSSDSLLTTLENSFQSGLFLQALQSTVATHNPLVLTSSVLTSSSSGLATSYSAVSGYGIPTAFPTGQPTGYPSFAGIVIPAVPQAVKSPIPVALISGITVGGAGLIGLVSALVYYLNQRESKFLAPKHMEDDQEIAKMACADDEDDDDVIDELINDNNDGDSAHARKQNSPDAETAIQPASTVSQSTSSKPISKSVSWCSNIKRHILSLWFSPRAANTPEGDIEQPATNIMNPAVPDVRLVVVPVSEHIPIRPGSASHGGITGAVGELITQIRRNSKNAGRISPLPPGIEDSSRENPAALHTHDPEHHKVHPVVQDKIDVAAGSLLADGIASRPSTVLPNSAANSRPTTALAPEVAAAYRRASFRLNQILPQVQGVVVPPSEAAAQELDPVPPAEEIQETKKKVMEQLKSGNGAVKPIITRRQTTAAKEQTSAFATKKKTPGSAETTPAAGGATKTWSAYAGASSITPNFLRKASVAKPATPNTSKPASTPPTTAVQESSPASRRRSTASKVAGHLGVEDLDDSHALLAGKIGEAAFEDAADRNLPVNAQGTLQEISEMVATEYDSPVSRPKTGGFINSPGSLVEDSYVMGGNQFLFAEDAVQRFEGSMESLPGISGIANTQAGVQPLRNTILPSAIVGKLGKSEKIGRRTMVLGKQVGSDSDSSFSDVSDDLWIGGGVTQFTEDENTLSSTTSKGGHRKTKRNKDKSTIVASPTVQVAACVASPETARPMSALTLTPTKPTTEPTRPSSAVRRASTVEGSRPLSANPKVAISFLSNQLTGLMESFQTVIHRPRSAIATATNNEQQGSNATEEGKDDAVDEQSDIATAAGRSSGVGWFDGGDMQSVDTLDKTQLPGIQESEEFIVDADVVEVSQPVSTYDAAIAAANLALEQSLELKRKQREVIPVVLLPEAKPSKPQRPSYLQPTSGSNGRASMISGSPAPSSAPSSTPSSAPTSQQHAGKGRTRFPPGGVDALQKDSGDEARATTATSNAGGNRQKRSETTVRKMNAVKQKRFNTLGSNESASESESGTDNEFARPTTSARRSSNLIAGTGSKILGGDSIMESEDEHLFGDSLEMTSIASSTMPMEKPKPKTDSRGMRTTTVVRKLKVVKQKRVDMISKSHH